MSQSIDHPELTAAEWEFLQNLRALPDTALRHRIQASLNELLFFFQNPKCQGIGVEGFPCGDPRSSCDDCRQIWEALGKVAERSKKGC